MCGNCATRRPPNSFAMAAIFVTTLQVPVELLPGCDEFGCRGGEDVFG